MPIRIFPCSENLPARLADELAQFSSRDFSSVAVVVPSRRLGNYVRRALAERVIACIPPRLCTLDELVALISPPRRLQRISPTEQALALSDLLRTVRYRHFRPGMEEDLARFFDELMAEDLLPEAFQKIRDLLSRDEFKDERHLERLQQQVDELQSLHTAYQAFLQRHHLTDAAQDVAVRVKFIPSGSLSALRSVLNEIFLLGFVDATRIQKLLLGHLLTKCNAQFWTHAEPTFLADQTDSPHDWRHRLNPFGPLTALLNAIGEKQFAVEKADAHTSTDNNEIVRAAYNLPVVTKVDRSALPSTGRVHLHEAATPLAEVKAAAALIRKLVHQQGILPHDIVVVVPDEQIYGRLVWSVFAEASIQTNNSLGMPLLRTRVGQWLHLLLTLVQENWRLADLISFLHHPFSEMWMTARSPHVPAATLQQMIERCLIDHEIARGQSSMLDAIAQIKEDNFEARTAVSGTISEIQDTLLPLSNDDETTLVQWIERLLKMLEHIALERWIIVSGGGAYQLDAQALQMLISTLHEMQRIGEHLQKSLRFDEFFRLLNQHLFANTVRPVGEPYSDVQVMGLLESRSVPAKVFIVLGNNEGSFPTALGRELFLEEPLRTPLGLTTYHKRELLQDMYFYRLAAGASAVHLFYCRMHNDEPRVRSRFVERLLLLDTLVPGVVNLHRESGRLFESDFLLDTNAQKVHEPLRERARLLQSRMVQRYDQRGVFPPGRDRDQLFQHFSATTLQMLFHCPYRFLLHSFQIESRELPADEADSLVLGNWLHRVFQFFFQGITDPAVPVATENEDLRDPWTTGITPENSGAARDRLQRLGRVLMTSHAGLEHFFYQMLYVGWPAFIEQEIERGAGVFQPEYFEFNIENALANPLLIGSHQVGVRGRIDRIFLTDGPAQAGRLIDYKLSGFRGSEKSILEGKEPQLPLYGLALLKTGLFPLGMKWIGEYWSIRHGESKTIFEEEEMGLAAGFDNLISRWQQRLDQLKSDVPFDAEVTSYCEQCVYKGICRREELFYLEHERKRQK